MGLLDDAIREHLELKRRLGADSSEIDRLEDEAFGPPARPGDPDFPEPATGEEPVDEAPTSMLGQSVADVAEPQSGPEPEIETGAGEPAGAVPFDVSLDESWETPAETGPDPAGEPRFEQASDPESELAEDPLAEPGAGLFDLESTAVELDEEPDAAEQAEPVEPALGSEAGDPMALDEDPLAGDAIIEEPPSPVDEPPPTTLSELPESPAEPVADAPVEPEETTVSPTVGGPTEPEETTVSPLVGEDDDAAEERDLELDAHAGDGFDDDVDPLGDIRLEADDDLDPLAMPRPVDRGASPPTETTETPASEDDEEAEDVLEETPEFLRDQPEDDDLWFEQGEPKDFDFD